MGNGWKIAAKNSGSYYPNHQESFLRINSGCPYRYSGGHQWLIVSLILSWPMRLFGLVVS